MSERRKGFVYTTLGGDLLNPLVTWQRAYCVPPPVACACSPFNHVGPSVLWRFDPAARRWSRPATTGDTPTPRIHHAACVVADRMFVIGGFERRFGFPMRVVHALHLPSLAWTVFPTSDACPKGGVYRSVALTHARGGTGPREGCAQICLFGVATPRTLVPTGGDRGIRLMVKAAMEQLYGWKVTFLDADTGEWLSAASPYLPTLAGSSGFVYADHLYMTMSSGLSCTQLGSLTRRCVDESALEQVQPLGAPRATRCLGSCVVVDDRVFFIGGANSQSESGDPSAEDTHTMPNRENTKYKRLKEHYGSVQVLDFRPNLQTMCIGVITRLGLDTSELPLTLQHEVELCSPKFRPGHEVPTDDIKSGYEICEDVLAPSRTEI